MTSRHALADPAPVVPMRSPGEIVSAIPFLLGFVPDESVVLITLRETRVGLTARVDLADVQPEALETIVGAVLRDGATSVILAGFGSDHRSTSAAVRQLRGSLLGAGVPIMEAVSVVGGRWFHETCTEARCCPPDGTPVADHDQAPSTLALSTAKGGYRADRETVAADCLPQRPLLTQAIRAELAHPMLACDVEPATVIGDMVAILGWDGSPEGTSGQLARAGLAAHDPGVRDVWYALVAPGMLLDHQPEESELCERVRAAGVAAGDLSPEGVLIDGEARERILARLLAWVRDLPDDVPEACVFPFIIVAMAHWCAGDGIHTRVLVERASALDYPPPGMLETLQSCVAHGVRPPEYGWLAPQIAHHRRQEARRERIEAGRMRGRRGRRGRVA